MSVTPLDLRQARFATAMRGFDRADVTTHGVAIDRKFTVKLDPITPALTRMKLVVSQHGIGKDRATAGEIISQVEQRLRPAPSASPPND